VAIRLAERATAAGWVTPTARSPSSQWISVLRLRIQEQEPKSYARVCKQKAQQEAVKGQGERMLHPVSQLTAGIYHVKSTRALVIDSRQVEAS
jgi:hypothetical protein